ncbi:hypothetical protein SAE01_23200 [Segetibacter aerophilus]|uniref:Uncharacterized protein n=2 Tax=Segetibacter aerophilus TaxID=670293 RepID=A0A512BD18_9BACT|nr:hypothetical protein SAE01_23200 [Segetibacter aerophilus]
MCKAFVAFIFSSVCSGCFQHYFKVVPVKDVAAYPTSVERGKEENRFFILHAGSNAYSITTIHVNKEKQQLELQLSKLDTPHTVYVNKPKYRVYKPSKGQSQVLTEMHLYSKDATSYALSEPLVLPIAEVSKIELVEKDVAGTTASTVFSLLGVTLGAFALLIVIVALTKSSCPFVSGYDGNDFKLQGEIYAGAIYPALKRDDYLPLQLKPLEGKLQVKISNELQERQYTDLAELWTIEHEKDVDIVPDEQGNLYSVAKGEIPSTATVNGRNVLTEVSQKDETYFPFNNEKEGGISELEVTFSKPHESKEGKLLLHLKNSYWLDYIYGELIQHMGGYFNKWSKLQKNKSAEQLVKWKNEQAIPLTIEMKTATGWKEVKTLTTVGPVAYREMAIPLNISESEGAQITLRLSSGFMFWELDRVAIDYTPARAYTVRKLKPVSAIDELGKDVSSLLLAKDNQSLNQPIPGNVATISFDANTPKSDKSLTYILHTSGYYEHVRSFKGMADIKFLKKFKEPLALSKFSMERYHQINSSLATKSKK